MSNAPERVTSLVLCEVLTGDVDGIEAGVLAGAVPRAAMQWDALPLAHRVVPKPFVVPHHLPQQLPQVQPAIQRTIRRANKLDACG